METPTTDNARDSHASYDMTAAITVAEFARRSACGEILGVEDTERCAAAHRLLLGPDTPASGTDETEDDRVFNDVFCKQDRTVSPRDHAIALAGFVAGALGVVLALWVHVAGR